jgi:hypothetical protein
MISISKRVITRVGSLVGLTSLLLALVIALKTDAPRAIGGQGLGTLHSQAEEQGPIQVGEIETTNLEIGYLNEAGWIQTIHYPGAAYIKVHLLKLDLMPGDYVTVSDPSGIEVYTYPGSDYTTDGGGGFWAISITGDTAVVELHCREEDEPLAESKYYEKALAGVALQELGVVIDKYARGYPPEEILERIERAESTCGTNERTDVICYQSSYPTEYNRSHAVALLLIDSTFLCTAWRASSENRMFTNEHCVTSQSDVSGSEVWFNYQRLTCGSGGTSTPTIVTGNTLLVDDYTLDFALFTVNSFSSISSFGYLELDVRTPVLNEEIYIPQHGDGNPKEFGIESDLNTGNVCRIDDAIANGLGPNTDTGYYCDTAGGSSGSPVLARSSHQVIALHHWGADGTCPTDGMNQGVRIDQIWPLVASYFPGPVVVYDSRLIDDDNSGNSSGNDDGIIDPGETIELYVILYNQGVGTATSVNAAISTSDPYVTFTYNTSSNYPDIPGGSTGTNGDDFDFEVDSSAPDGHIISFDLDITSSNGGPWSDSFGVTVGGGGKTYLPIVLKNSSGGGDGGGIVNGDFENGPTGWVEYSTHGWDLIVTSFPGSITPRSGSWAVWLGGDYNDISYIQQQVTVPAGSPYLAYWHWIASEDVCGWDYGGVIVNDTTVEDVYDLCISTNTGGWVKHVVNLSAYTGQSVSLQIWAETDGSLNSNLVVDDVAFQASASSIRSSLGLFDPINAMSRSGKITPPDERDKDVGDERGTDLEKLLTQ